MVRRAALLLTWVVLALTWTLPAQAEIWAYRDKKGVTHYAERPLNSNYELLYRGSGMGGPIGKPATLRRSYASAVTQMELSTRFKAVRHLIREASSQHGVEFELLQAVISAESAFDPQAVSPKGAVGLMQLIPETAERFGVRPVGKQTVSDRLTDPRTNIQAGSRYLAWLINYFNGDMQLAVAAYNAGEGAVIRAGRRIPNYPETISYVRKVTDLHASLKPPRAVTQPGKTESATVAPNSQSSSPGRS